MLKYYFALRRLDTVVSMWGMGVLILTELMAV